MQQKRTWAFTPHQAQCQPLGGLKGKQGGVVPAHRNSAKFETLLLDSFIPSSSRLTGIAPETQRRLNKSGSSEPQRTAAFSNTDLLTKGSRKTTVSASLGTTGRIPDSLWPGLSRTSMGLLSTPQEQIIPEESQSLNSTKFFQVCLGQDLNFLSSRPHEQRKEKKLNEE